MWGCVRLQHHAMMSHYDVTLQFNILSRTLTRGKCGISTNHRYVTFGRFIRVISTFLTWRRIWADVISRWRRRWVERCPLSCRHVWHQQLNCCCRLSVTRRIMSASLCGIKSEWCLRKDVGAVFHRPEEGHQDQPFITLIYIFSFLCVIVTCVCVVFSSCCWAESPFSLWWHHLSFLSSVCYFDCFQIN